MTFIHLITLYINLAPSQQTTHLKMILALCMDLHVFFEIKVFIV